MSDLELGDIVLDEPIGRGGMAIVWRGRLRRDDLSVAVKVLDCTDDPVQVQRFHDEVRSVARLRHRNITDVVEMGVVPDSVVDRGPGLQAGSPWLAMEFVDGGTLREHAPRLTWKDARGVLSQMLAALSHAHARGVIHRDLKPSNILLSRRDGELRAHVSDFGIAHTRGLHERDSAFEEKVAGTPRYMSPEQIQGRWRDHGPWTDLYAVGCIAYWLVSGRTPFEGDDVADLLRGHLYSTVEPLEDDRPLPAGFDRWVGNLLRKQPHERARSAADAAYGLARLGATEFDGRLWQDVEHRDADADITLAFTQRAWATADLRRFKRSTLQILPGTIERPPIPRSWRPALADTAPHPGLSLFTLRTPPLVGREQLRDYVWSQLRAVHEDASPRCVVLRGQSGTGKSRLAEWLGHRAVELGAATRLVAHHAASGGPTSGLGAMFARHLECFGLGLPESESRIRDWWGHHGRLDQQTLHDARVLARYMPFEPGTERDSGYHVSLGDPFETFERALRVIAAERPVYLWLDDVQWDQQSIDFARWILAARDLPLLVVCTAQSEALANMPQIEARLEAVERHERTSRREVDRLSPDSHRELIGRMLRLDPNSVEEIARRTSGNPLFAVQLLGECVERDALEPAGEYLRLVDSSITLSGNVNEVWLQRVDHALADLALEQREVAWQSLELAAALGSDIEDAQWRHACNLADLAIDETLFERYLDSRLVERAAGRWSFVHSTLRDVLEQRSRSGGRWRKQCLVCAESARWFGPRAFGELEHRRATYFVQASDLLSALGPLYQGAHKKLASGRYAEAERIRERYEAMCDALDLPDDDEHRIRNRLLQAEAGLERLDLDQAVGCARLAVDSARRNGQAELTAHALGVRARIMMHRDLDEAIRAADESAAMFAEHGTREQHIDALLQAASVRCYHPTVDRAEELAAEARELTTPQDRALRGRAHLIEARALRQRSELREALEHVKDAHEDAVAAAQTLLAAQSQLETSRLHRLLGEPRHAERWAQRARNTLRAYGDRIRALAEIEIALASRSRSSHERTRSSLELAVRRASLHVTDVVGAEARFVLAENAANHGDFELFASNVEAGRPAVEVGKFDRCMAIAIEAAADAAAAGGRLDLCEELWALGRMQWRRLGTTTVAPK